MTALEKYRELITLTRDYLKQEHSDNERLFVTATDFLYFYDYAVKKKKAAIPISAPTAPKKEEPAFKVEEPPRPSLKTAPALEVIAKKQPTVTSRPPLPLPAIDTSKSAPSSSKEDLFFIPASPASIVKENTSELFKLIATSLPHLHLVNEPPDDSQARLIANTWQQKRTPQVIILSFDEIQTHLEFLQNVAKAIHGRGYSVEVIKIGKEATLDPLFEEKLQLIIGNDSSLHTFPNLSKHYRESTKSGKHYLKEIPLLLLSDISFYLKEPSLKLSLWNAIKEKLPTLI